ncbi:hypothetical protein EJD97_013152 [Solanum chilense]|uniref:Uncharacterized protein n=1 Tax=Solanum chilense TaxID=4083 RepID=A0A6N2CCD1_SOLCI|nr:hypothetical protein EJD97_013152 [Solanum chilense]
MNAEVFEQEMQKSTTYGTFYGRWGSLIKCGVTECATDRRSHDDLSSWFVMKIKEVATVPKFQQFKCYGTETLEGPLCL